MPTGGLIVAGVLGAASLYRGIRQDQQAKNMAAANTRPTYTTPQGITDNVNLAESRAGQGIDAATTQAYQNGSDRALSSSLSTILKGGGDLNQVGAVQDANQSANAKFAMADEQQRLQNIGNIMIQRQTAADYADKAWTLNSYGPYADKAAAATQLARSGNASINSGVGTIGAAAMAYSQQVNQNNQNELNRQAGINNNNNNSNNTKVFTDIIDGLNVKPPAVTSDSQIAGNPMLNYIPVNSGAFNVDMNNGGYAALMKNGGLPSFTNSMNYTGN